MLNSKFKSKNSKMLISFISLWGGQAFSLFTFYFLLFTFYFFFNSEVKPVKE